MGTVGTRLERTPAVRTTAALYARVSTPGQDLETQLMPLRAYASGNNWEIVEYPEKASGKAESRRPVLQQLMADAQLKKFDVVAVWQLDRFGRDQSEIVKNIGRLNSLSIRFVAASQGIDTDLRAPDSRERVQLFAVLAEAELKLINERLRAGQVRYRRDYEAGKIGRTRHSKSGKDLPVGQPRKVLRGRGRFGGFHGRPLIIRMLATGMSRRAIAKELKVDPKTIRRLLAQEPLYERIEARPQETTPPPLSS